MGTSNLIIYHSSCLDGFGSAYAAYAHFELECKQSVEFLAAAHGDSPPLATGKTVYLLDYAYPRDKMEMLCAAAREVIVLDHHITALNNLAGLDQELANLTLHLDMNQSGAMLAWRYFHSTPAPRLIECVQDRDMWRWQLPESYDLNTGLMSYSFDFDQWHRWATDSAAFSQLVAEGVAINRYRRQMIEQNRPGAVMAEIAGYLVPVVNCPRAIASELIGELAEGHPFAAGYTDKQEQRSWSLRSGAGGIDVAKIAELFGGGGHKNAAGFVTPLPLQDRLPIKL